MTNIDLFKNAYLKCLTESSNKLLTLNDINNLKSGDIITLRNFRGKKQKYHFDKFVNPNNIEKSEREIFVKESNSSITIKLPEWDGSAIDLIDIKKNNGDNEKDNYTFFITSVSDNNYTYYAVGSKFGSNKPNYTKIQKRLGEKYFNDYYMAGIKKTFKSYNSFIKFCNSLEISSKIPSEEQLTNNTDSIFYIKQ